MSFTVNFSLLNNQKNHRILLHGLLLLVLGRCADSFSDNSNSLWIEALLFLRPELVIALPLSPPLFWVFVDGSGWISMDRFREFGRRAWFYVRVLSGYEVRRIRNDRLELERRLRQAQEKKAAMKKIPEQIILKEVRRMVEDMQALNNKLEETEAAISEYFKPLDKQAEMIMKMQLDGQEKTMDNMMEAAHKQALLEQAKADIISNKQQAGEEICEECTHHQHEQDPESSCSKHAQVG